MQNNYLEGKGTESSPKGNTADEANMILDIFIASHCTVCNYSREIYEMILHRFPAVTVRLISVDQPGVEVPESVFATPTYLLNGRVWSLGNPSQKQIEQTFAALP